VTHRSDILDVLGHAAITPAGASAGELLHAVTSKAQLPVETLERGNGAYALLYRRLEKDQLPIRNPRLRRAPAVAHHALRAAFAALGEARVEAVQNESMRLGIICTLMNGCVNYSNRFFSEVRNNPATASPILFPETVYNAPASHLSAVLASRNPNYTLLGDSASFAAALQIAADWLADDWCDGVLLVAAEEFDWLSTEALQLFHPNTPFAESAAALYLELPGRSQPSQPTISLRSLSGSIPYLSHSERTNALTNARRALTTLPEDNSTPWLIRSQIGCHRQDHAESDVWQDWSGPIHDPFRVLGHPLGAAAAVQCALAAQALHDKLCSDVVVSAVGNNQQCVAAHFATKG